MRLILLSLASSVAFSQPGQESKSATAPFFTVETYIHEVIALSPEAKQAQESFEVFRRQWLSTLGSAALPTLSFNGIAYPYGYNPANNYRFNGLRLNRSDMQFTTTANWNLFNSFQDYTKVRSSSLAKDSAHFTWTATLQDRALIALQAFYDLNLKRQLRAVTGQNLAAQEEQYRVSKDLYAHGLKSLADLLKSETDWRSAQLRMTSAAADEKVSLLNFNLLLDRTPDEPAELKADLEPGATTLPAVLDDLGRAMDLRPEILKARADVERGSVAVEQAVQSNFLPSISLNASWSRQDPQILFQQTLPNAPNPNYQLSLGLSLPFGFNIFSQTQNVLAARADQRRLSAAFAQTVRQVREDLYQAFIGLEESVEQYRLSSMKETIANRTLNLVTEQYRQGSADAIRLAQAQLDYLDARVARSQSLNDIFTRRAQYRLAIGETLWQ